MSGNDAQSFRLVSGTDAGSRLELAVSSRLDHELTTDYQLVLAAVDGGVPARTGFVTIHIHVADSNDNRPVFDNSTYLLTVREDAPVGTSVIQVHAMDRDSALNGQVRYHIDHTRSDVRGHFKVNDVTGVISTSQPLDFELIERYELVLVASDQGSHSLQTSAVVTVQVSLYSFIVSSIKCFHGNKIKLMPQFNKKNILFLFYCT